LLYSA